MLDLHKYLLEDPDQLITPCLLVYPELIANNLEAMLRIAGDVARLRPHVKTHKTPEVVAMQLNLGITKFKCATLREAEMLGTGKAPDVLVAYPQIGPAIRKLLKLVRQYPATRYSTVVDDLQSARALNDAFAEARQSIDVLVDIDSGMQRTGIPAGEGAFRLYEFLHQAEALTPGGLHVYDGQNHQPSRAERESAVAALMDPVLRLVGELQGAGHPVPKLVCGGTPTFPIYADFALPDLETAMECSPGTCILSDYNYGSNYPDISGVVNAAVLMTRVISKQSGSGRLTLDLGNKAVAADPPAGRRCHFLSLPDAKEIKQNEEHLIVETSVAEAAKVGDVHYVIPAHICPTVALHRELQVVQNGKLTGCWEVSARDRVYRP